MEKRNIVKYLCLVSGNFYLFINYSKTSSHPDSKKSKTECPFQGEYSILTKNHTISSWDKTFTFHLYQHSHQKYIILSQLVKYPMGSVFVIIIVLVMVYLMWCEPFFSYVMSVTNYFWWGYPFCTRPTQWVVLSNASSLIQCISILTHYPDWHFVNIQDSILNMVVFYHYIVTTCYWGRKTWTQKPVGQQVAQQMTSKSIR